MIVLHKTPTDNVKSIFRNGLKASIPFLTSFEDVMVKDYDWYNKDLGLIFTIPEDTIRRDKYIKDFIYWKLWGDPRNRMLPSDPYDYNLWDKVFDTGVDYFKCIKPKDTHFTIFQFEITDEKYGDNIRHGQYGEMGEFPIWIDMETRYEHGFKPLVLINENIPASKISIIGTANAVINKRNKIDISIKL